MLVNSYPEFVRPPDVELTAPRTVKPQQDWLPAEARNSAAHPFGVSVSPCPPAVDEVSAKVTCDAVPNSLPS